MPRQSRRKTLSPSKASTFLSSVNLSCDPLSLPSPPTSPFCKDLDASSATSVGLLLDENGVPVDEVDDTLNILLTSHLSPPSSPLSPVKKEKKKKRRTSILTPHSVPELQPFTTSSPPPVSPSTSVPSPSVSVSKLRTLIHDFYSKSPQSSLKISRDVYSLTGYPLLSLPHMNSTSSSNTYENKRSLLLRLSPHFTEMEASKKSTTRDMELKTGCVCERGRGGGYVYFEGGEEVDGEEYGRRYMEVVRGRKVKEEGGEEEGREVEDGEERVDEVEEEEEEEEEELPPMASDSSDSIVSVQKDSVVDDLVSSSPSPPQTDDSSKAKKLKEELFERIDQALKIYVDGMKDVKGGIEVIDVGEIPGEF
ncbi:hypothetical protein TrST_g1413 [Triparma strigata]|uniref:Uncharacterized protein n=1 Tax=Triparma strigata TaxID=1606541 RepID=A0A9W7C1M3_9STRA|nr:hypothetical protein TrST_g1413 [Triparma strigata]